MKLGPKEWKRIRDVLRARDIDHSQVKHINCVRMHPTETDEHWDGKQKLCRKLYKMKHPYICEVWTADHKKRYDVLDLEDDEDYEIETGKSKQKTYKGDTVINV